MDDDEEEMTEVEEEEEEEVELVFKLTVIMSPAETDETVAKE